MLLSVEMKSFFEKVGSKNFSLACNVYHALAFEHDITPETMSQIRKALRLAA